MTTYYKVTFSDGFTTTRSTANRTYTHAWRIGRGVGFSGSELLAEKALAYEGKFSDPQLFRGVAPVVEITSKEYRASKQAA